MKENYDVISDTTKTDVHPGSPPLGFLHPDSTPVTHAHCLRWATHLTTENTNRAKALRAIEQQGAAADAFEYAELVRAAKLGVLRLRVWSALEVLAREAVSCCD